MKMAEILEAFSMGKMPEPDDAQYLAFHTNELKNAAKVADISKTASLFNRDGFYYLVNKGVLQGHIKLSNVSLLGKNYLHVDGIFIRSAYRKTAAASWLLYGVKEIMTEPVIADGATFADGGKLIQSILAHAYFRVSVLNKLTGEKEKLLGEINDDDKCYMFEQTSMKFSRQIFVESMGPSWIPLFEELEWIQQCYG